MHLCDTCKTVDWDARIAQARVHEQHGGRHKAYCPHCTHIGGARVLLPHASHTMCEHCAVKREECQACGASTLPTPEQARREAFETFFDAFVTLVKTFGITPAVQLVLEKLALSEHGFSPTEAAVAAEVAAIPLELVDSVQAHERYNYRRKRPIWTKVHGQLTFGTAPPRCADCTAPPRSRPAMVRATRCGHWTAGEAAEWCLPCAVAHAQCASCCAPTE